MKLRTICRCDEDGPLDGRVWGVVTLYGEGRSSTHYVDCPLVQEAYARFVQANSAAALQGGTPK